MLHYADLENALEGLYEASHWYVGFSGGVDSTVLLHLLQQWRAAHPESPVLSAIHVNHGLQSAAAKWQIHCEDVCRALGLTLDSHTVDVGAQGRGEAAAREARYRVFTAQLQPGGVLFLGHQLDDQVETFFLRLLRGAGVTVEETTLKVADFMDADEVFSSGNNSKIVPINRIDGRELQPGPMMFKARQLYWDWAHGKA